MSASNNVLIVCRDLKSARRLRRFKPEFQSRYILASDDPRVQELAKEYLWIDEICWIEQMESFYNVADDVIRLTEIVNEWLKTLADNKYGFPEELFFFTRHVEGGMTTQRIQDALLLIRSYFHLFDSYCTDEMILLRSSVAIWEDDLLVQAARTKGIAIQEIGKSSAKVLIAKAKTALKNLVYEPYFFLNYLEARIPFRGKKGQIPQRREIVFQLCGSAAKHVENITPLMKALEKRAYFPIALCWGAGRGANEIRKQGLHAVELENWLSCSDWLQSFVRLCGTWIILKKRKNEFINHPELSYFSVPLGTLLWPSIRYLLFAELGKRYRLISVAKAYFAEHRPLAIKLWGGVSLPVGMITWNNLGDSQKPMLFGYWLGVGAEYLYSPIHDPTDLWFATGELQKGFMASSLSISREKIAIVGQARYHHLEKFKKKFSYSISRSYLKIPSGFSHYILYDYPVFLRGYHSMHELAVTVLNLLDFVKRNKRIALIIKPHPAACLTHLNDMMAYLNLSNVFVLNRGTLPYHALNCSDILITKYSTMGVEAMLFNKPVISLILDQEKRWKIYEDAGEYIFNLNDLTRLLNKIANENNFFLRWKQDHLRRQKEFLKVYFDETTTNTPQLAAKVIDKYIKDLKRLND
jgi:hypothetical protein